MQRTSTDIPDDSPIKICSKLSSHALARCQTKQQRQTLRQQWTADPPQKTAQVFGFWCCLLVRQQLVESESNWFVDLCRIRHNFSLSSFSYIDQIILSISNNNKKRQKNLESKMPSLHSLTRFGSEMPPQPTQTHTFLPKPGNHSKCN